MIALKVCEAIIQRYFVLQEQMQPIFAYADSTVSHVQDGPNVSRQIFASMPAPNEKGMSSGKENG